MTNHLKRDDGVNHGQRETSVWTFESKVNSFRRSVWLFRRKSGPFTTRDSGVNSKTGIPLVPSSVGFKAVGT